MRLQKIGLINKKAEQLKLHIIKKSEKNSCQHQWKGEDSRKPLN